MWINTRWSSHSHTYTQIYKDTHVFMLTYRFTLILTNTCSYSHKYTHILSDTHTLILTQIHTLTDVHSHPSGPSG